MVDFDVEFDVAPLHDELRVRVCMSKKIERKQTNNRQKKKRAHRDTHNNFANKHKNNNKNNCNTHHHQTTNQRCTTPSCFVLSTIQKFKGTGRSNLPSNPWPMSTYE
eukprot:m.93830 g.93830  ORF g.93830 m.93830 type:complete len:107 (+) comp26655_c0_seq1:2644-2964(+)